MGKVKVYEKEVSSLGREVEQLRSENKGLDGTRFSQEKTITELRMSVQGLERQVQEKESIIENKQVIIEGCNKQNVRGGWC